MWGQPSDCTKDAITSTSWILEMDQGMLGHLLLQLIPRERKQERAAFNTHFLLHFEQDWEISEKSENPE